MAEETPRTFTQEQVDEIVERRFSKERAKIADLETKLSALDELQEKAKRLDEIEAASASELEKAVKRAERAEQAAKEATQRFEEATIRSAVIAEASKQGAVDPDVVAQLVDRSGITLADGAAVGADEAVASLLEAKTFLKAGDAPQPQPGPVGGGPMPPAPASDPEAQTGQDIWNMIVNG